MGDDTGLLIHDGEAGSLSPEAHARMDREVKAMLERLYDRTREVIQANREPLAALAVALLERETIEGDEAVEIMGEAGTTRPAWLAEALAAPQAPDTPSGASRACTADGAPGSRGAIPAHPRGSLVTRLTAPVPS
jgi:cell division protease FtsH